MQPAAQRFRPVDCRVGTKGGVICQDVRANRDWIDYCVKLAGQTALTGRNYSTESIGKILGGNMMHALRACLAEIQFSTQLLGRLYCKPLIMVRKGAFS